MNKNRPKITHFSELEISTENNDDEKGVERLDLQDLYPTLKTYDQKKKELSRQNEMFRRRLPKYPAIQIGLIGSLIFIGVLLLLQNVERVMTFGGDVGSNMTNTFAFFGAGMILAACAIAWVKYTNDIFNSYGGFLSLFWIIYGVVIFLLTGGWLGHFSIPVLASLHFGSVYFSVMYLLKKYTKTYILN
jgi:magnesium-transporting ATPase (P-type)